MQHELFTAPRGAPPPSATRDAAARRRAVTEFERPLLLEAGAGTGKTATLVARVVHWCLGPGWESEPARGAADDGGHAARVLSGVAAMTFTEAAAAEMSSRVGRALASVEVFAAGRGELPPGFERAALPQDPAVLAARASALRGALDHLSVGTIHAFCRRILAAHPLEAGLRPDFEVDATLQQAELAVHDALAELLLEDWEAGTDGDWIELARRKAVPPLIEAAAVLLIAEQGARSADFLAVDPLPEEGCAQAVGALALATAELAERARELAGFRSQQRFNTRHVLEALDDTERALAECPPPSRAALVQLVPRLSAAWKTGERAKGWRKVADEWRKEGLNKGESAAVADQTGFLAAAQAFRSAAEPFLELDPELLELVRRVIGKVLARAEALLRARGIATFSDLLSGACALLGNADLAARERGKIRQLLVDEFQDTDQEQCEIVGRLGLEGAERPGLFLVGDPKQSIFAWRNADLEAYDDFAERLEAAGGERLTLDANFRSRAEILEEVERIVGPVMEWRRGLQPPFVALEAAHPAARAAPARPAVEHWISWPRDESGAVVIGSSKGVSYASEARALARDIAERRAEGVGLSDCAVILRSMTGVEAYLRQLRMAGVPYEVQSDRRYYQRREVLDAAALVRTVLDPTDHAALVGLLRSPAVGLPDAALLPLWAGGFPGELTRLEGPEPRRLARLAELIAAAARQVPADVPELQSIAGWEHSLQAAVESIAKLRGSFRVEPLDRFIEGLRAELLPDAAEAARYLGEFRLANLERFYRELSRGLEASGGDPRAVLSALRANLGRQDRNEVSRPGDSRRDAVQVLTIHAAKGLEFRHVYLVQTHRGGRGSEVQRGAEFERRGGAVAYRILGAASLSWALAAQHRSEIEAAERVRLLYVMLTRAAERVVIVGAWPEDVVARPWQRSQNANELCRSRPGAAQAVAAVAQGVRAGSSAAHTDSFGVAWRLAELQAQVPSARETRPKAAQEQARAGACEARELAAARERAELHMARPFSVAASAEAHLDTSELAARRVDDDGRPAGEPLGRNAAQAAGTAVHRLLEKLVLQGDLTANWRRAAEELPALLERLAPAPQRAPALERARELVERIAAGGLLGRLAAIGPDGVVARELNLLVPPAESATQALGFVSGTVDLVYRDPSGELVVVDYKTDLAETEEALTELADAYRAQGTAYAHALCGALGLTRPPRFELWFLHAGRVLIP